MGNDEPEFPVASGDRQTDNPDETERSRDPKRERSVMEQLNAPARPGPRAQKSILWFCLFFLLAFLAMTATVIAESGPDFVMVIAVVLCSVAIYALVGMIRYKGEDPMAQFDPPPSEDERSGRRE